MARMPSRLLPVASLQEKSCKCNTATTTGRGRTYWAAHLLVGRFLCVYFYNLLHEPASQPCYTYCQSKAHYSWNISRKISPYKQMGRTVGYVGRCWHGARPQPPVRAASRSEREGGRWRHGTTCLQAALHSLPPFKLLSCLNSRPNLFSCPSLATDYSSCAGRAKLNQNHGIQNE